MGSVTVVGADPGTLSCTGRDSVQRNLVLTGRFKAGAAPPADSSSPPHSQFCCVVVRAARRGRRGGGGGRQEEGGKGVSGGKRRHPVAPRTRRRLRSSPPPSRVAPFLFSALTSSQLKEEQRLKATWHLPLQYNATCAWAPEKRHFDANLLESRSRDRR